MLTRKVLSLLMTAAVVLSLLLAGSISAGAAETTAAEASETLNSTLLRSNVADPWLFTDGEYFYLTMTGTSRIAMFKAESLEELGSASLKLADNIVYTSADDPTVTELFGEGATLSGTWSPEVYYFSEEQYPGYSGWYMFLALRKNTGDSSAIQMVVLKSTTGDPKGPYGHPITGEVNHSQPVLDKNGRIYSDWGCGMGCVTIAEGSYKGLYTMWVTEVGRGEGLGKFYQKIMITKMANPWTMAREPGVITTPTQEWEYAGSSSTHPRVVEGATAVYGAHGEVFLTYSGSGYWSNYGLGQLTWTGGDPLLTSSWHKLEVGKNPIFSAVTAANVRGAGHASFLRDAQGNGFLCYHAYPYVDGTKASSRSAYIEPYYIDYTEWNGVSYGVIHCGVNDNGVPANTATKVTFATEGEVLGVPRITASAERYVTLNLNATAAEGYTIYRSTDGKTFTYLGDTKTSEYVDTTVANDKTYYYRAYSYRNEEVSTVSAVVSITVPGYDKMDIRPSFSATQTADSITLTWGKIEGIDGYKIYRKAPGETSYTALKSIYDPETTSYTDPDLESGNVYGYLIHSFYKDGDGTYHFSASSGGKLVYTQPTAPKGTTEYAYSGGVKITITESVVCTGYAYARSDDGGHSFNVIYTGPEDSYVDNNVEVGKTYYYRVYAYAGDITVRSGSTGAGSIVAWPEAPVIASIECNASGVTFTWDGIEGVTGYKIWRKLPNTSSWTNFGLTNELSFTDTTAEAGETYVYAVQAYQTVDGTNYYSKLTDVTKTFTADANCSHIWTDGLCSVCGALCGHADYHTDGSCSNCGMPNVHTHSYTASVTQEPSCGIPGTRAYTCSCGDTYTEEIVALTHNYVDGTCEHCGEAEPVPTITYTVAGSAALCGSTWDGTDVTNLMTQTGTVYTKVYTDVALGEGYQIKIVRTNIDGTLDWIGDSTGNNITFNVTKVCDVTVTFNPDTNEITVTGDGVAYVTTLDVEAVYAVGQGVENWLNGVTWDPGAAVNKMTEVSENVYQITYSNLDPYPEYTFKFAANGSWADSWGGTLAELGVATPADYNGQNIIVDTTAYDLAEVTITLDLTNFDYTTKSGATFTVTVTELVTEPELFDITFAQAELGNALSMRFAFPAASQEDWTGAYAVATKTYADGRDDVVETIPAAEWKSAAINGADHYYFSFNNISGKEMSDDITVVVYNAAGEAISNPYTDSIRTYIMRALDTQTNAKVLTLMVDMLNYGATAQSYFGYGTGDLANALLSDEQKALGTQTMAPVEDGRVKGDHYLGTRLELKSSTITVPLTFSGVTVSDTRTPRWLVYSILAVISVVMPSNAMHMMMLLFSSRRVPR